MSETSTQTRTIDRQSVSNGEEEIQRYLVVGVDLGNGQRYADYFLSPDPVEAEEMAHQEIEETGGGLLVAAVILDGQIVS